MKNEKFVWGCIIAHAVLFTKSLNLLWESRNSDPENLTSHWPFTLQKVSYKGQSQRILNDITVRHIQREISDRNPSKHVGISRKDVILRGKSKQPKYIPSRFSLKILYLIFFLICEARARGRLPLPNRLIAFFLITFFFSSPLIAIETREVFTRFSALIKLSSRV